jgi:hypothetical protein
MRGRRRAGTGKPTPGALRLGRPRWRHRPDDRRSCPLPADQHAAGHRGVTEPIGVLAEAVPRLGVGHPPTVEEAVQAGGKLLRLPPARTSFWQSAKGKDHAVARGHDVRAEPRSPDLDKRPVLPAGRVSAYHPRVDRQERRPRHAVLQTRPRRTAERARAGRQPLIERADVPPERQDLRPRELKSRPSQRTPLPCLAA